MLTRSREGRKRRSIRAPGIWRGSSIPAGTTAERPALQQARGRGFLGARMFSGLIVISLITVLFLFFSADAFYVQGADVIGLRYMTIEEIFDLAEVRGLHIFWVDPEQVRESLLRSPTIADATIEVGWPPDMVRIIVQERQPALVWEQAGASAWVDLQGRVMRQREDRPDLIRIVVDNSALDNPVGPESRIDPGVVNGALQLQSLFPNMTVLRYNPEKGLGYQEQRGWMAWFGSGIDMPDKILVYDALVNNLLRRGIQPLEVNVGNPDAPYYATIPGR